MTKKESEELKRLQSLLSMVQAEVSTLEEKDRILKNEINSKKVYINELFRKIRVLQNKKSQLIVSEHAIIRYLERVVGMNSNEIIAKIIPEEVINWVKATGNGSYPVNNGEFRIKVKDGVVVTVLGKDQE